MRYLNKEDFETPLEVILDHCKLDHTTLGYDSSVTIDSISQDRLMEAWNAEDTSDYFIIRWLCLTPEDGYEFDLAEGNCTITPHGMDKIDLFNEFNDEYNKHNDSEVKTFADDFIIPFFKSNPVKLEECVSWNADDTDDTYMCITHFNSQTISFGFASYSESEFNLFTDKDPLSIDELYNPTLHENSLSRRGMFTELTVKTKKIGGTPEVAGNYGFRSYVLTSEQLDGAQANGAVNAQFLLNLYNFPYAISDENTVPATLKLDQLATNIECRQILKPDFTIDFFEFDIPADTNITGVDIAIPFYGRYTVDPAAVCGHTLKGVIHYERITNTPSILVYIDETLLEVIDYNAMLAEYPYRVVPEYGKTTRIDKRTAFFNPHAIITKLVKLENADGFVKGEVENVESVPLDVQDLLNEYFKKGVYYV